MNIEQRIKEIEKKLRGWDLGTTACRKDCKDFAREHLGEALEVINHLQSEVERYKSLWEANAAESKEIIAELKGKDEWRDISSAPKDGSCVLLYVPNAKRYKLVNGSYESFGNIGYKELGRWFDRVSKTIRNPTHWKPLPKPPKQNH